MDSSQLLSSRLLSNKHLVNIILNYISFPLKYQTELLNKLHNIYELVNVVYFYDKYWKFDKQRNYHDDVLKIVKKESWSIEFV
jgi:hypothetical protein